MVLSNWEIIARNPYIFQRSSLIGWKLSFSIILIIVKKEKRNKTKHLSLWSEWRQHINTRNNKWKLLASVPFYLPSSLLLAKIHMTNTKTKLVLGSRIIMIAVRLIFFYTNPILTPCNECNNSGNRIAVVQPSIPRFEGQRTSKRIKENVNNYFYHSKCSSRSHDYIQMLMVEETSSIEWISFFLSSRRFRFNRVPSSLLVLIRFPSDLFKSFFLNFISHPWGSIPFRSITLQLTINQSRSIIGSARAWVTILTTLPYVALESQSIKGRLFCIRVVFDSLSKRLSTSLALWSNLPFFIFSYLFYLV